MNSATRTSNTPRVSVVVPVRNGVDDLRACLAAITASTYAPHEVIVVDDASTDDVATVARSFGARVFTLRTNRGPAFARNRGAEVATGDLLFFTDADVRIHSDTIERAVATLLDHPNAAAVMGSYDETPADPHFIAQYKNLFHHWVHQHAAAEASSFWTGCGAVWRDRFLSIGGFNEGYRRPSIEDIELGFRIHKAGLGIRLDNTMLATHAKRWKLFDLIRTDVMLRGVPWIALMLRDRRDPKDLNLSVASKIATVIAGLFVLSLPLLAIAGRAAATLPALLLLLGCALVSKLAHRRDDLTSGLALGLPISLAVAAALVLGDHKAFVPLGLLAALVISHTDLYSFFWSKRGPVFAVAVLPMHLIFQLCCAASVPLGWLAHRADQRRAKTLAEGPALRELPPLPRSRGLERSLGA